MGLPNGAAEKPHPFEAIYEIGVSETKGTLHHRDTEGTRKTSRTWAAFGEDQRDVILLVVGIQASDLLGNFL